MVFRVRILALMVWIDGGDEVERKLIPQRVAYRGDTLNLFALCKGLKRKMEDGLAYYV